MSESESDTSPGDAGEEDVLFPLEGQFYSEKDKAEIMAMPEVQREELLAERAEEAARRTQDLQLRRLLQARGKEEAKAADKKKRKAGAADLDESQRKSSRPKTKASESLETYKRQREQRNQQRRRETDHKNRDRRSRSRDSDRSDKDAEGESEVEWDEGGKAIPGTREEQPVELRDIERVRVGRSNFAKVCFYPGFEDAITGCFCRISIGVDRATGHNQYRMALVKGECTQAGQVAASAHSSARLRRRQTIPYGGSESKDFHDGPVCGCCTWQSRKRVAIPCVLRLSIHGGLSSL